MTITPAQRASLDFRIAIAEQQLHPTFLCVDGEFLTLEQAKQVREEYDAAQALDSPIVIVTPNYYEDDEDCGYCHRQPGSKHEAWCRQ